MTGYIAVKKETQYSPISVSLHYQSQICNTEENSNEHFMGKHVQCYNIFNIFVSTQ